MLRSNRNLTLLVTAGIAAAFAATSVSVSQAEEALERREFLDGRVAMLIPKAFAPMSEEWLRLKYPNMNAPSIVLSDDRGTVNVAMDHKNVRLEPSQVTELHTTLERSFKNLYPSATWTRSEVVSIDGRQFALLDLYTPAIDGEIRNIMVATSFEGRLLIITFNCTYLSIRYTERLAERGINASVGSTGDSYDNALTESIIGLYKTEVIRRRGPWKNVEAVELATLEWVDWFNNRRLLEPIGDVPPVEFEQAYYRQREAHAMVA